jgi:hypothetical protein
MLFLARLNEPMPIVIYAAFAALIVGMVARRFKVL